MSIRLYQADALTRLEWYQKKASAALTFNDLVQIDANGFVLRAVDATTLTAIGLVQETVASSDTTADKVPVLVPGPNAVFLCDVGTGTAAQEDVGQYIDIDDHLLVDVNASTYDIFYVVGRVSATQVLCKLTKKSGALGE